MTIFRRKACFHSWAQKSDVTNDEIKQLMGGKKAVPYVWRCEEDIEPIDHDGRFSERA